MEDDGNDLCSVEVKAEHCIVPGCENPIVAELYAIDYARMQRRLGAWRVNGMKRRKYDPGIYVCEDHIEDPQLNQRLDHPRWQRLLFVA